MYQPKRFQKEKDDYQLKFIKNHPFATLIVKENEFLATHIPILIEEKTDKKILYGHIANHNKMKEVLKDGTEVLLIFQGAHGYISSSWYTNKDISTWDYSAVHVKATIKIQIPEELETSLRKLIKKFEQPMENPLLYDDIPQEIIDENFKQITGFWLYPTKIEAIAKYHQGFSKKDVHHIIQKLKGKNDGLAQVIKKEHTRKK